MATETATAELIQIRPPDVTALVQELSPIVQAAHSFQVVDVESDTRALEMAKALRNGERRFEAEFKEAKDAANRAHKTLCATIARLVAPHAAARQILEKKSLLFQAEQERIAMEKQRQLQEQARKEEEERKLLEAIEAEDAGDKAAAEAILQEPVSVPAVRVAPQVAQVTGTAKVERWGAKVTDLHALICYVAQHPEWTHLLEPAMPALNGLARSQREALNIPGVTADKEMSRSYGG